MRENVEQLTAIRDWAEAFFATAVVFEPLIGELFRSEFVMQSAALQGDFVTPTLMGAGESDTARDLRVARGLFGMLSNDSEHGEANRATMQGWLEQWAPVSVRRRPAAATDLVAARREGRPLRRLPRRVRSDASRTSSEISNSMQRSCLDEYR